MGMNVVGLGVTIRNSVLDMSRLKCTVDTQVELENGQWDI